MHENLLPSIEFVPSALKPSKTMILSGNELLHMPYSLLVGSKMDGVDGNERVCFTIGKPSKTMLISSNELLQVLYSLIVGSKIDKEDGNERECLTSSKDSKTMLTFSNELMRVFAFY